MNMGEGEQAEGRSGPTEALEAGAKPRKQSGHMDLGSEGWRPGRTGGEPHASIDSFISSVSCLAGM